MAARRLSILDTNFLQLESARQPMHVAGLMIFELPADAKPDYVNEVVERFRNCTVFHNPWNYRLKRAGTLQFMPLLQEVHSIDMEYHIRHLALPRPGGERQLGQMVARLHSQPLDLRRPLWEVHIIEGLENNRFALYLKIHHCLVDGVSATKVLMRALATEPDAIGQLPFWAVSDDNSKNIPRAQLKAERKKSLPKISDVLAIGRALAHTWYTKGDGEEVTLRSAPRSIINDRIHTQRRFATHSEPLDRIKAIAKGADASLNDIVLALTGTVLREYLEAHHALPEAGLTASIPVSLHDPNAKEIKNNIGMIFATLGTHIADDRRRLEIIKASTHKAKERLQALPSGTQGLYSNIMLLPYIGSLATGLAGRMRPAFNVVVSNVPGPKEPRYLFGARLTNLYPVSIPMHGGALNVTCFSHAGILNFGLTACRDSLPHMQQMAVSLGRAVDRFEELYCGKVTSIRSASGSN
ncbi:MAG: wax ester/triacylglycerol synthase family O-acyltransferase [Pseudomonadota bacterium]